MTMLEKTNSYLSTSKKASQKKIRQHYQHLLRNAQLLHSFSATHLFQRCWISPVLRHPNPSYAYKFSNVIIIPFYHHRLCQYTFALNQINHRTSALRTTTCPTTSVLNMNWIIILIFWYSVDIQLLFCTTETKWSPGNERWPGTLQQVKSFSTKPRVNIQQNWETLSAVDSIQTLIIAQFATD